MTEPNPLCPSPIERTIQKILNKEYNFSEDERKDTIDYLIDKYTAELTDMGDEILAQECIDRGLFIL